MAKRKPFKYFCPNCNHTFLTGKFDRADRDIYDDICPYCGAEGLTFAGLCKEYAELSKDFDELYKAHEDLLKKTRT